MDLLVPAGVRSEGPRASWLDSTSTEVKPPMVLPVRIRASSQLAEEDALQLTCHLRHIVRFAIVGAAVLHHALQIR